MVLRTFWYLCLISLKYSIAVIILAERDGVRIFNQSESEERSLLRALVSIKTISQGHLALRKPAKWAAVPIISGKGPHGEEEERA